MKVYQVSYYLGSMYHTYCIEAEDEAYAIYKALGCIPESSRRILHDFKIERSSWFGT